MPLTDVQVKNAKPGKRPPIRLKGVRNGSDESSPSVEAAEKNTEPARKYKTKSGEPPKSYKLYDGDDLYIAVFQNGSKLGGSASRSRQLSRPSRAFASDTFGYLQEESIRACTGGWQRTRKKDKRKTRLS